MPVTYDWSMRLADRMARCHCGAITPSVTFEKVMKADREDVAPAFFEYRGPHHTEPGCKRCGMNPPHAVAPGGRVGAAITGHPNDYCDEYVPDTRDELFDLYYCGCATVR